MRLPPIIIFSLLAAAAGPAGAERREAAQQPADAAFAVLVAGDQTIEARATIRIHARRETVWAVLTSCVEALKIVPGLEVCEIKEAAADQSWARIHQIMDYSRFVPRLSYEVKAIYAKPERISFERVSGDLVTLRGSWVLQKDGNDTLAFYVFNFEPGYWVPHWILRAALRRDLPRMLRALRANAEAKQLKNLG